MQQSTELVLILDRSGSMQSIRNDMEGAIQALLEEQKQGVEGDDCFVTLVQFDSEVETVFERMPIAVVPKVSIQPRASTALFDAVGFTLSRAKTNFSALAVKDRPSSVVVVIITDGAENSSKEYTKAGIFSMIEELRGSTEGQKWVFQFLGTNQDSIKAAAAINIPSANAVSFGASAGGVRAAARGMSSALRSYRLGSTKNLEYCQADYEDELKFGEPVTVTGVATSTVTVPKTTDKPK